MIVQFIIGLAVLINLILAAHSAHYNNYMAGTYYILFAIFLLLTQKGE